MARFSNGIVTLINLLTLVLSLCGIALSLWFYVKLGSPCERMVRMPLLAVGGALLVVSMMGLLGACCRVSLFMWLYLITLFVLIVGLIVFSAFAIAVTNKGIEQALSESGIGDGNLGDYSSWLQNYVTSPSNWDKIKSCLIHMRMCQGIEGGMSEEFYKQSLPLVQVNSNSNSDSDSDSCSMHLRESMTQSGCCKPPNYCGLTFKNVTTWEMPEKGPAMPDLDCKIWSNEQSQLCYNCESCKEAVLENLKREWRMLSIINTLLLISITIIYSVGCCALRNNQNHGYNKQYRGY